MNTREISYQKVHGLYIPDRVVRPNFLVAIDNERPLLSVLFVKATVVLLSLILGWFVLHAIPKRLPVWIGLIVLLGLGWICLRFPLRLNPQEYVRFRNSWATVKPAPRSGIWSGAAFDVYLEARLALGRWFDALILIVPGLATFMDYFRKDRPPWRWTEWAGAALALVLGVAWAFDELYLRPTPSAPIRAGVFTAWLIAVALPSWLVARRVEPRRWLGAENPGTLHDRATVSDRGPESTRVSS
jgi:putative Mn2+ efflux pump MntP